MLTDSQGCSPPQCQVEFIQDFGGGKAAYEQVQVPKPAFSEDLTPSLNKRSLLDSKLVTCIFLSHLIPTSSASVTCQALFREQGDRDTRVQFLTLRDPKLVGRQTRQ